MVGTQYARRGGCCHAAVPAISILWGLRCHPRVCRFGVLSAKNKTHGVASSDIQRSSRQVLQRPPSGGHLSQINETQPSGLKDAATPARQEAAPEWDEAAKDFMAEASSFCTSKILCSILRFSISSILALGFKSLSRPPALRTAVWLRTSSPIPALSM